MVSAWYMDDSDEDQRLDHQKNPPQPVDMKDLVTLTGVLYWKVSIFLFFFFSIYIKLSFVSLTRFS